jgi:hypothetical protein
MCRYEKLSGSLVLSLVVGSPTFDITRQFISVEITH